MTQTPPKGAELLALLTRCLEREYNGFGPGNQSKLYYDIAGTIHALTASEPPTVDRASLVAAVEGLDRYDAGGLDTNSSGCIGVRVCCSNGALLNRQAVLDILRSQP